MSLVVGLLTTDLAGTRQQELRKGCEADREYAEQQLHQEERLGGVRGRDGLGLGIGLGVRLGIGIGMRIGIRIRLGLGLGLGLELGSGPGSGLGLGNELRQAERLRGSFPAAGEKESHVVVAPRVAE